MNGKNKLLLIFAMLVIVCAVTVMAGYGYDDKNFKKDKDLKKYKEDKKECHTGITENVSFVGSDGRDMIMIIRNGLIVGIVEAVVEVSNETNVSDFPVDGLVAYYKLDETFGNSLDAHGSNDLTNANIENYGRPGKLGTSLEYNGATSTSTKTNFPGFNSTGMSFQAWVYPDEVSDVGTGIFAHFWIDGNNLFYLQKHMYLGGFSTGSLVSGTWYQGAQDNSSRPAANWYHVVGTYNKTSAVIKLYVNGQYISSDTDVGSFSTSSGTMTVGTTETSAGRYEGKLDEVGIWNRPLTAEEVSNLYNNGNGLAYNP